MNDWLRLNGIDGATGAYNTPELVLEDLVSLARGTGSGTLSEEALRFREKTAGARYGVAAGVDATNLAESGWGLLLPHGLDPAICEALEPLLQLRREQAGKRFRVFEGPAAIRPGESKNTFLARHGVGPGPVDPDKIPYYLLLVAPPELVPFSFQFQLDVQFAVGRLWFDRPADFACYAGAVVRAERGDDPRPARADFLATSHQEDPATQASSLELVQPLADSARKGSPDWQVKLEVGAGADKARFKAAHGGSETPALLFAACHGVSFPLGDPRQAGQQGALLAAEWPGPTRWRQALPPEFYLSAADLAPDADFGGALLFYFACFGAGTPQLDEFARQSFRNRRDPIAAKPMLAPLAQAALCAPGGPALAVIGHIDRAWGYGFHWPGAGRQTTVFESALKRLFDGDPLGLAFEYFDERKSELAFELTHELEEIDFGGKVDPYLLAGLWTAHNDARGYVVLGDPAVRANIRRAPVFDREKPHLSAEIRPKEAVPQQAIPPAPPQEPLEPLAPQPPSAKIEWNPPDIATRLQPELPPAAQSESQAQAPTPPRPNPDLSSSLEAEKMAQPSGPDQEAWRQAALDYGIRDWGTSIAGGLKEIGQKAIGQLGKTLSNLTTMEVRTYACGPESQPSIQAGGRDFGPNAPLVALTRIELDQDIIQLIAKDADGKIDEAMMTLHRQTVNDAIAGRERLLKSLIEAATTLARLIP